MARPGTKSSCSVAAAAVLVPSPQLTTMSKVPIGTILNARGTAVPSVLGRAVLMRTWNGTTVVMVEMPEYPVPSLLVA